MSGAVSLSILSSVFSIFNLALLFYYDTRLTLAACGLVAVSVAVTLAAGYAQVRRRRDLARLQGHLAGMVRQFITGIGKFRVAGIEGRAFARWAQEFCAQKQIALKARTVVNRLSVFNSAYPVLTLLVIYAMVVVAGENRAGLSTGAFLAFSAAFTQFLTVCLALSASFLSALYIVPIYERVRPILQPPPEVGPAKSDPDELTGEIEISHVVFRYREDEPLVLQDVSLHIERGEFVAVVGPSGCGKSTLVRLMLGFEAPLVGAVYYDGQDLAGLDTEAVRRQIGAVLQDGKLMTGSILDNIIGSSLLTIEDAREAMRMVGLDQEIEQMPMKMHTVISEGGSNLSGGQRQRLLIARAIVHKLRLLIFDEATSALDNRAQAIVGESLERLGASRVVIAHRLSTILHADCIYVVNEGRVVQSGAYDELMRQEGLFADLARRQLA